MTSEVGCQPALLRRAGAAADDVAVGVQRDEVPAAEVVRVPTAAGRPGARAEVAEVARSAGRPVLVVAGRRVEAAAEAPPCRVERRAEVVTCAGRVLQVTEQRDRVRVEARDDAGRVSHVAGRSGARLARGAGDVAGRDERGAGEAAR